MSGAFTLRGYTVQHRLGRGSSGEVWQARVASSGAPVALKRIAAPDDEQLRRAQAEAALLAALDHPNLVRLHAIVPTGDALVLVLDLAGGGSLADLLAARGRLTAGEVVTAIAPVAAALAYLHGEGVVHGDVSAANILFTADGAAQLCDVGVARLTGDDADAEATPAYVDPAVAAGCVPGPPSDVFMLAGVALHALTGAPPWPAETPQAALALAAQGQLTDVGARLAAAGVPPEMAAVLTRALAVDPQRRGTAADLALDLRYSARPVAVELAAGRPRGEPAPPVHAGPRHAAVALPGRPSAAGSGPVPADAGRPEFDRPAAVAAPAGVPPTRMVGPRPRPVIPRPARRPVRRLGWGPAWAARWRPRWVLAGAGLVAVALVGIGGVWLAAGGEPRGHRSSAAALSKAQPQVETSGRAASPRSPAGSAPVRPTDWPAALSALDAIRAAAYARRDPTLLRKVYLPGPLLQADAALLARIVPAGCGLRGARTHYTGVRVAGSGERTVVTVSAVLAPSQLVCAGTVRASAPGAGPRSLRLVLARTGSGLRIAEQRPV